MTFKKFKVINVSCVCIMKKVTGPLHDCQHHQVPRWQHQDSLCSVLHDRRNSQYLGTCLLWGEKCDWHKRWQKHSWERSSASTRKDLKNSLQNMKFWPRDAELIAGTSTNNVVHVNNLTRFMPYDLRDQVNAVDPPPATYDRYKRLICRHYLAYREKTDR